MDSFRGSGHWWDNHATQTFHQLPSAGYIERLGSISALISHCLAWLDGVTCPPLDYNTSSSPGSLATSKPYRL